MRSIGYTLVAAVLMCIAAVVWANLPGPTAYAYCVDKHSIVVERGLCTGYTTRYLILVSDRTYQEGEQADPEDPQIRVADRDTRASWGLRVRGPIPKQFHLIHRDSVN